MKRLLCIFFLFLACFTTQADVFVVTSNADSGPGTLREALTLAAANGTLVYDNINFDLPGDTETDRTILLQSELPLVSSHVIIDGTTQPGPDLGNGEAKVMIKANRLVYQSSSYAFGCFNIVSVTNVEIYGCAFDQFIDLKVTTNPDGQLAAGNGVYVVASSDITIGGPRRGNVFIDNGLGVHVSADQNNQNRNAKIKVQANWFGLNLDGSESSNSKSGHASIVADDMEFGGPDRTYGNVLGGYSVSGVSINGSNVKVRSNWFGYLGDKSLGILGVGVSLGIMNGEFTDNLANRFGIDIGGKNLSILRNKEFAIPIQILSPGIRLNNAEDIQIGNDNIADVNEFLPRDYGPLFNFGSKNVEVRKNIIHCTQFAYSIRDGVAVKIQVLVNNDSEYSGTATPNSEVYIYNDNTDCPSCSPLQFYEKVRADVTGKWGITGNFSNNRFIANTTLINTSSEFTQPRILNGIDGHWYIKTDPSCGESNGKLALANPANLLKVEWYDSNDVKVGDELSVENLPPGEYYAKGYNGKCYTLSPKVVLFNVELEFVTTDLKIQQPGCGKNNGSIKGLYYTLSVGAAVSYKWVDENNQVLPTGDLDLNNVGPGSYTLVVTMGTNCTKSYGPIVLKNTIGPGINRTDAIIMHANCDNTDGSITGVTATGFGNIQFVWKDEKDVIVAQTADLINVRTGKYTLEVKDESACGIISSSFEIPAENTIGFDEQAVYITKTTCENTNGSITGIKLVGTGTVKWLNENNVEVGQDLDLIQVPSGKYKMVISNAYCTKTSSIFTIEKFLLPAPVVLPVQICAAGRATIVPDQIHGGEFLLYPSLTATQPIATTKDIFNIQVSKSETYFVSYANGICESVRVPVLVEITENSLDIANAFSPNNDGVNDTWRINGLRSYPEFVLKIFSRYGQNVFTTRDPHFAFDGTRRTGALPVGVYYYVLNLRAGCSTISGSLTLIR
ncbi:gliding motility-associated C-terminal domain-containing protein [Pedobacter nyackensis]|uniref:Gliding motility-associated C-terminal domain-containing protein n=1 Tax=Pedobacter nyackensis TaxID=475255 RepID=A0A1W2BKL4_9SPHI|nr:gliding motility-associated C-terminal domain-containing protein [Pedobacter nyackensis]SMC73386.1 gliding motility-associated C-terminal domain-containing protein [Pedobacter nyackensis]